MDYTASTREHRGLVGREVLRPVLKDSNAVVSYFDSRPKLARAHLLDLAAFCLLIATVALLIVVSTIVPATAGKAWLSISNETGITSFGTNVAVLRFGISGYCVSETPAYPYDYFSLIESLGQQKCNNVELVYDPISAVTVGIIPFPTILKVFEIDAAERKLSPMKVLHPFAAALTFLALVFAALPCYLPPISPLLLVVLAFIVETVGMAGTFVLFRNIKTVLSGEFGITAEYGGGLWFSAVATICVFIATIILSILWWRKRQAPKKMDDRNVVYDGQPEIYEQWKWVGPNELDSHRDVELSQGTYANRHELAYQCWGSPHELCTDATAGRYELAGGWQTDREMGGARVANTAMSRI
ncbi:uncharacterized protein F4822DRAFT_101289 [Hypoxylon trugodes]|uniref:uncharacterized protein n=1 Tax=Hypoxylon trugodes TaxID=326681 RepID=UPI0021929979|nr:uncharacterized protein F4822DRAFT_101289 [Hypoxylon trugodes]KAI1382626.1 hypothetical protein F4822DRAFT_101289 [Hypoxylon trugodes]